MTRKEESDSSTSNQLIQVQREMLRMRQEVHAMQCILDGVVAMHPRPEELLKACRQVQDMLVGPLNDAPLSESAPGTESAKPSGMAGWRTVMQRYIEILEQGVRLRKPSPAP